jgi:excisionase family DNA binding protein
MNARPERLLKLQAVADLLGISVRQVYRLVARGELPPLVRDRRSSWLPESEVAAYIEKLKRARPVVGAHQS